MEEGPAIAALFFFAVFFKSKTKITFSEMVIVATMGSAGGSLGFMSNYFAAQAMVVAAKGSGEPLSILQMTIFCIVTSIVGIVSVVFLRQILIVKNEELPEDQRLPWVGSQAVKSAIDTLLAIGESIQPRYLAVFTIGSVIYVLFNDSGIGWVPEERPITLLGLSAFGAAIAFGPFLTGASYLMGMRTCVGFLVGGIALVAIAPLTPNPKAPNEFIWPGVMFLVTSGLTALVCHWRMIGKAVMSLFHASGGKNDDPIMSGKMFAILAVISVTIAAVFFYVEFKLTVFVIANMIVFGGIILQIIASRGAAQTAFNPIRVMSTLLAGMTAALGASNANASLSAAGFMAGTNSQATNLLGDMAYGRWYRIFSRWQFWTQTATILLSSVTVAIVFYHLRGQYEMIYNNEEGLKMPVAKMWATMCLLFDPDMKLNLPKYAVESMWIAGAVGVIYALFEELIKLRCWMPGSVGIGLGMVLSPSTGFGFFLGGLFMFYLLGRYLKMNPLTLNTIAISCIVGEGIGGILTSVFKVAGLIG